MNYLKILGKSFIYIISILLISTFVITILNYFNIFNGKIVTFFKIVIALISMFVGGFIIGKNSKQKGWLEGLKLGIIILIILFIINYLILKQSFDIKNLIYYLILLSSIIFGSMIGINKKTNKECN